MSDPLQPPPSPEQPPSPIAIGARWGAVAGIVLAQLFLRHNSPLGFYTGNMFGVFAFFIGLGTAVGAGIGWLSAQPPDEERFRG